MNIETIESFDKELKTLSKRFKNIKTDFKSLLDILHKNPKEGESLGNNLYKIRLKNSDINRGKRGGYRVISYYIENNTIYLINIYFKGDKDTLSKNEILELMEKAGLLLK